MATATQVPELVRQKLAVFARIQPEFEECFRFKQAVHGQERFASFPIAMIVYYFHALWLCECKDRLLRTNENMHRYEGQHALTLLHTWQEGQNTEIVAFLVKKLDMLSFTDITFQLEEAHHQRKDKQLADRIEYGRLVMLNRGMNFLHALEAIFSLSHADLLAEVSSACEQYGHTPTQLEAQLAELETPLYTYLPHQLLAQQNMVVMNRLGVKIVTQYNHNAGELSRQATSFAGIAAPFAEQVIDGYLPLSDRV